jgi:N-acetylmuramic acid 6-phosphate etherase
MSEISKEKAENFLSIASQFKLGSLVTESSNLKTLNLSELAQNEIVQAISVLKEIDNDALAVLSGKKQHIFHLKRMIKDTLDGGNNIFFCGCGATGRLSLTIETLWRQIHDKESICNRVFSFMAGGDVALIRSIENFEDFSQYGARQLIESGFRDGDLLIGTTEGGETPFVIGAVEKAARISERKPFFLYCNPDDILCEVAERSKLVIQNPDIEKINLTVGPMAITGSTRMQSSTILLAAAAIPLLWYNDDDEVIEKEMDSFFSFWKNLDISFLQSFIIRESELYGKGDYLLYETDNKLGITVITDTTERSPTFSLYPFENLNETEKNLSLCYLYLPEYDNSRSAWEGLLWRGARTLEWTDINGIASENRLLGFDFSSRVVENRERYLEHGVQHIFRILDEESGIIFQLGGESIHLGTPTFSPLFKHLTLKMILNTHSTLVMGRLGRYEGNVMTFVRASNNKLIDRAIRYIDLILKKKNINLSYSEVCYKLFEMLEKTPSDKSIVLATVQEIENI